MVLENPKCKRCGKEIDSGTLMIGGDLCTDCSARTYVMGACERCGVALTTSTTSVVAPGLCTSCGAMDSLLTASIGTCERCGAALIASGAGVTGQRLCISCMAQGLTIAPLVVTGEQGLDLTVSNLGEQGLDLAVSNLGESLNGLLQGTLSPQLTPIIEPREDRVAFLETRVRELEDRAEDSEDLRRALDRMKRELRPLRKQIEAERRKERKPLDFDGMCRILDVWIPRRRRKYEEAYKAELAEYLRGFSTNVEEEPRDGITDILVEDTLPVELKVDPTKGQYNELCGKLKRVVNDFGRASAVILRTSSLDRYEAFLKIIADMGDAVRIFPKA